MLGIVWYIECDKLLDKDHPSQNEVKQSVEWIQDSNENHDDKLTAKDKQLEECVAALFLTRPRSFWKLLPKG